MYSFKTVWISDTHLGSKACRAEDLLSFLHLIKYNKLYLVGDIVDISSLERKWFFPAPHINVINYFKKASSYNKLVYIPGNHDVYFRSRCGSMLGNVPVLRKSTHTLADGRKILIMHGDEFDTVINSSPRLSKLGDILYDIILDLNVIYNSLRIKLGWGYWSLSSFIKSRVKYICRVVSDFENSIINYAKDRSYQIVICGHIHEPCLKDMGDIIYANCGDWVESRSALVETWSGELKLVKMVTNEKGAHKLKVAV